MSVAYTLDVVLVGSMDRAEFRSVVERLRQVVLQGGGAKVRLLASGLSIPAALAALPADERPLAAPDVLILLQSFPGEYAGSSLEELRRRWPLVRLVLVAGPWCEGETRDAPPPPGVMRWPWHLAADRLCDELAKAGRGEAGEFSAPLTMTADERFLASAVAGGSAPPSADTAPNPAIVAVVARDQLLGDWLEEAVRAQGQVALRVAVSDLHARPVADLPEGTNVVLWECDQVTEEELNRLTQFAGSRPRIVLVGFPRPEDAALCERYPRTRLVAKPVEWELLGQVIKQVLAESNGPKRDPG